MCLEFGAPFCNCRECAPLFGAYLEHCCSWGESDTGACRHSFAFVDVWEGLAHVTIETRRNADGSVELLEAQRDSLVTEELFEKVKKDALNQS